MNDPNSQMSSEKPKPPIGDPGPTIINVEPHKESKK